VKSKVNQLASFIYVEQSLLMVLIMLLLHDNVVKLNNLTIYKILKNSIIDVPL
jgi:hypothetical protein